MSARRIARRLGAAAALWLLAGPALGQQQSAALPQFDGGDRFGAAACGRSGCHGSVQPEPRSRVQNNEFRIWESRDKHSRAYKVLTEARSQRIARNLKLAKPAHEAEECLDCHADNVAPERRKGRFQVSDGVGCEACHGSASKEWYSPHQNGELSTAALVERGMYPTHDPVARATLCLSCHFGTDRKTKFVTHRIMGAGHPRMIFELDNFTYSQPAHFTADADYRQRKADISSVQVWAVGQALAISVMLESVLDPNRRSDGAFPELVVYDCQACHHRMDAETDLRWRARASVGLPPGVPRFNDANLTMLRLIAQRVDPELARQLQARTLALHRATLDGAAKTEEAASALLSTTRPLVNRLARHPFKPEDMRAILTGLADEAARGEYPDFAAAEQTAMATATLLTAMKGPGGLDDAAFQALSRELEKAYAALQDPDLFRPADFATAMGALRAQIR